MSRGFPSLTALLGLLAVAGFQNRDKIADMLRGAGGAPTSGTLPGSSSIGSLLSGLGGAGGQLGAGSLIANGLRELTEQFGQAGQSDKASSWIGTGPNLPISSDELATVIGPDVIRDLQQRTGLSREDLLSRLSAMLPKAVDQYTPEGRVPDDR